MELMDVKKLIPHKDNKYFFDDMSGEAWMAFLESIQTSGVIEPVIATQDLIIVSGHQRIRACKELGIDKVLVDIRKFDSEDEILKQLIETNIRQRGVGNTNPVKFGRCIAELERIYGIRQGSAGKVAVDDDLDGHNVFPKTQSDLAEQLDISTKQLNRFKSLTNLIPELQTAVESGQITATTAMGFVKKLSPEEQKQLAEQIVGKEKVSGREIDFYTKRIKALTDENAELRNRKPEVQVQTVEVMPSDYASLKNENQILSKERKQYLDERNAANEKLRMMEENHVQVKAQMHLEEDAESFIINTYSYIKNNGGLVWVTEKMSNLPKEKAAEFKQAIFAIDAFAKQMVQNAGGYSVD